LRIGPILPCRVQPATGPIVRGCRPRSGTASLRSWRRRGAREPSWAATSSICRHPRPYGQLRGPASLYRGPRTRIRRQL